ncbi:MAG: cell division FtsA domain-containing protein [Pseudomonadota bacterium]
MAYLAAAVDIGSWSLKVALGKIGVKTVKITDLKEVRYNLDARGLAAPAEIERALEECFLALPIKPEVVFSAVSGRDLFSRFISVPKAALKRLDQVAPLQIEDELPVEIDEFIVDAAPQGEAGDGNMVECVVAAARKDMLRGMIDLLTAKAADPAEITCGISIYPYVRTQASGPNLFGPVVVLDMGHRSSELVFMEGAKPQLFRSILWGGKNVTEAIAAGLGITFSHAESIKEQYAALFADHPVDAGSMEEKILTQTRQAVDSLVLDLRHSILSYSSKHGKFPQTLLLCGGSAKLRGIERYFRESLNVEAVRMGGEDPGAASFVRVRTLAGDAAAAGRQKLNFRKGEFVSKGKGSVAKKRWTRAVAAVAAIVIGWLLFSTAQIASLEKVIEKQHQRLGEITAQITGEEITDFSRAELLIKKSAASKNPVPKADAFDILTFMSKAIPEDVVHDVEELDIRPERWRIRGMVDSISDRDKVYEALIEYKDCIKAISKGKTTLSVQDSRQKYNFDMETTCP